MYGGYCCCCSSIIWGGSGVCGAGGRSVYCLGMRGGDGGGGGGLDVKNVEAVSIYTL